MPRHKKRQKPMAAASDTEAVARIRKIISRWHLARGALNGSDGLDLPFWKLPPGMLADDEAVSYQFGMKIERLPTDTRALFGIEEILGMAPKSREALEKRFRKWVKPHIMKPGPGER